MLIIFELDVVPLNSFIDVFFLLQREHVLVKLLLELFVGVINAKLFERVLCENFEAEDV